VLEALWVATGGRSIATSSSTGCGCSPSPSAWASSPAWSGYQFGTNWARFSDKVGAVSGPLMGYEVMTAFFLEAGFLGILLFGRQRVGRGVYLVATLLVAVGTLISAIWILAANSWMQTPQGYTLTADGRFLPADWWQIVFNPSFPYRLVHMVIASYLSVAFAVGAVGAWHLRRDAQNQAARLMFSMAMWMAVVVAPIQILAGDQHGLNTLDTSRRRSPRSRAIGKRRPARR
jgi:cytochrome d ubiquinol oxidase subunit I